MHRPKRQVADRGNAPEIIATRLCHYDQVDGIARLVFSTPSIPLPGLGDVEDEVILKLILPIGEIAHLTRALCSPLPDTDKVATAAVGADAPLTQH